MKTTTFIAILLTFLMLLLVLLASVVFLWQGRQEEMAQIGRLQTEGEALQGTATVVRSYLTAREEGLATARAEGTAAAQSLARTQATAVAVEATRESVAAERDALSTRVAAQDALLSQPPAVAIISPRPGSLLPGARFDEAGQILVAGSHPQGISNLRLRLAGNEASFPGEGASFRVFSYAPPVPLPPGVYTVTATITATNDLTATTTSSFRVPVIEIPESDDTQGGILMPPVRSLAGVLQSGGDPVDCQKDNA